MTREHLELILNVLRQELAALRERHDEHADEIRGKFKKLEERREWFFNIVIGGLVTGFLGMILAEYTTLFGGG